MLLLAYVGGAKVLAIGPRVQAGQLQSVRGIGACASAYLRFKHPEAEGMRVSGHIIAPAVVIVGLFLLMFDAEAGYANPLPS